MAGPENVVASIVVSSPGPGPGTVRQSPYGPRRSKDGAALAHVTADGEFFFAKLFEPSDHYRLIGPRLHLVDPTIRDVQEALQRIRDCPEPQHQDGRRHTMNVAYSGHGQPTHGSWVLRDGVFTAPQLIQILTESWKVTSDALRVDLFIDACFAGAFLAEAIASRSVDSCVRIRDAHLACLHDESAWEMSSLHHGALTFVLKHPGNAHVDSARLARAVDEGDEQYIRASLHSFVPNPVTYLTQGDQHTIVVTGGHHCEVQGGGYFEIPNRHLPAQELCRALSRARRAYGQQVFLADA